MFRGELMQKNFLMDWYIFFETNLLFLEAKALTVLHF